MRIAYFDCFSGISGDMTVAAFLDAGLNFNTLSKELAKLKLKGYRIEKKKVKKSGLVGTKFECVKEGSSYRTSSVGRIISIIEKSALSKRVKDISGDIFDRIGKAEAKIHGIKSAGDVHLHELGDIDSIVDIVGSAIAVDELGIDEIYSSRLDMGRTFVDGEHGRLPIPSPASLEILKGVPVAISEIKAELVTPTGAGILRALCRSFGRMPQMDISAIGYGAGTMELDERPNMLRVIIGESHPAFKEDRVCVMETNIDDMSPQGFEYVSEKLFKEGALDVYIDSIQMKKSRPAFKLSVLAEPSMLTRMASIIFKETTAIGVRFYEAGRFKLERKFSKVKTKYGDVSVKMSGTAEGVLTAMPEYEECVKLARKNNIPLKKVYEEARRAVNA